MGGGWYWQGESLTGGTGAVFSEPPQGNDPSKWAFSGSTLNVVAKTREEVVELLRNDVYAASGVWDVDNVSSWPHRGLPCSCLGS